MVKEKATEMKKIMKEIKEKVTIFESQLEEIDRKKKQKLSVAEKKEKMLKSYVYDKELREILALLPSGITLNQMKFSFIDKVIDSNEGNVLAAAKELGIAHRSLTSWIYNYDLITAKRRRRSKSDR